MSNNGWINKAERPPTKADADAWNCILAWHVYNGLMITGVAYANSNDLITYWQPTIPCPEEYKDRRKHKGVVK